MRKHCFVTMGFILQACEQPVTALCVHEFVCYAGMEAHIKPCTAPLYRASPSAADLELSQTVSTEGWFHSLFLNLTFYLLRI